MPSLDGGPRAFWACRGSKPPKAPPGERWRALVLGRTGTLRASRQRRLELLRPHGGRGRARRPCVCRAAAAALVAGTFEWLVSEPKTWSGLRSGTGTCAPRAPLRGAERQRAAHRGRSRESRPGRRPGGPGARLGGRPSPLPTGREGAVAVDATSGGADGGASFPVAVRHATGHRSPGAAASRRARGRLTSGSAPERPFSSAMSSSQTGTRSSRERQKLCSRRASNSSSGTPCCSTQV